MNYAMRVLSLLSLSISLCSCLSTPGIEEPEIVRCVPIDEFADCINLKTHERFKLEVQSLTGYQCVSPMDGAKIDNHHDALHTRLNQCENGR